MPAQDVALKELSRDPAYDFSYPRLPGRSAGLADRFPGLPLLVVDQEKRIVWGHDHFRWLRAHCRKKAEVLAVDISPAQALFLNFNLSSLFFGLNLYEKLLFTRKISAHCTGQEIQRRADLGFALTDALLQRLDELLSAYFRPVLAAGRLGLKTALQLADFSLPDCRALLTLFKKVRFSESQQALVIQLLEETAFREKKSLASILAAARLGALLKREMPQKRIIDALQAVRYPALTRHEEEWRTWSRAAGAGKGLALTHSPLFASEEVQVTLSVKNRAAAEKLLQRLKIAAEH